MEDNKNSKKSFKCNIPVILITALTTCLLTIIVIFAFVIKGESIGKYVFVQDSKEGEEISSELKKYKTIVDQYFLGDADENKMKEGAIKGYIEGLDDPYTEYLPKKEMKEFMEDTKGNFVGIGIYMTSDKTVDLIKVLSTMKDSPAEKAGIKAGDYIKTVNGEKYTAADLTTISSKIKGEEGTKVKLEILRDNETLEFEVVREKIDVKQVDGKVLQNNIGYIDIASFDESTANEFKEKFEELQKQNIKGLIIDLRNNGGGIVSEALKIADFIADKDSVLLYEVDKNNKEEVKKASTDPIINMPVIILTNGNTASASEILAGALKDLGKAKIVGTKTYGKGVIQEILTLTDGSGLKITTEEYKTPNKTKIHKVGIEPDEKVELPEKLKNNVIVNEEDDVQLQKAIEMLK